MTAKNNFTMNNINNIILNFGLNQDERGGGVCAYVKTVCMIIQEVARIKNKQKLMSKNGMFQSRSAVYTSGRFPRSLLSLFSFR